MKSFQNCLFRRLLPIVCAFHLGAVSSNAFAVTGDDCVPVPAGISYHPSLFECNGNAAIFLRGDFRSAYSVVVRRGPNIQYNDRDPHNTACGLASCSPYKTQENQEYSEFQVRCLGDSGFNGSFDDVTRISVKFGAEVTNSRDPSQFQQYCIPNVEQSIN